MASKIWIINILFVIAIVVFSIESYDVWFLEKFNPAKDLIIDSKTNQGVNLGVEVKDVKPASFYSAIVEKNLFFSDRTGVDEKSSEPVSKASGPKISEQAIVLYGVMMAGEEKKALISNPFPKKEENKTIWVKEEERLGDDSNKSEIMIKSILKDKIVVSINGEEFDCYLYQKKDDRNRSDSPGIVKPAVSNEIDQNPIPRNAPAQRSEEPPSEISPDGKYKIYETPFGKIKRRIN